MISGNGKESNSESRFCLQNFLFYQIHVFGRVAVQISNCCELKSLDISHIHTSPHTLSFVYVPDFAFV